MNIAEILKNVPRGTKLYSPAFGEVTFKKATGDIIVVDDSCNIERVFFSDGRFYKDSECVLFPSKECRDWSNFSVDLPEGTPVMVSDEKMDWKLRFYSGQKKAYHLGKRCGTSMAWVYIVPVHKFNFTDYSFNKEDNYGVAVD